MILNFLIPFLFLLSGPVSIFSEQNKNIQFNGGPLILQTVLKSRGLDMTIEEISKATNTAKGNTTLADMSSFLKQKNIVNEIRLISPLQLKLFFNEYDIVGIFGGNKRFIWIREISDTHVKFFDQGFRTKDRIHRLPLNSFNKEIHENILLIKKNKHINEGIDK